MRTQRKRLIRASCVLLMSGGMLTAMFWLWSCHCAQTAARLGEQLEQLPDDELVVHVRRLTRLGDHALPLLCAALSSPRAAVADAADHALCEELARWELLAPRLAGRKLAMLSELLAQQSAGAGHVSPRRLADLAARLLAWPKPGLREMPQIAAHCQRVLESAAADPREPQLFVASQALPIQSMAADVAPAQLTASDDKPAKMTEYVAPPLLVEDNPSSPPPAEPQPSVLPPALLPTDMSEARPLSTAKPPEVPAASAAPLVAQLKEQAVPLEQLNTIPLAQLLHGSDASVVRASRAELARRGHPPLEIYLQERLTDPDPRVRSQAAGSLPSMPGMDARPWLLSLSRDESGEVRLVALTLMATSGESQMLRRVKEMAQTDTDPRVRSQAQRIER